MTIGSDGSLRETAASGYIPFGSCEKLLDLSMGSRHTDGTQVQGIMTVIFLSALSRTSKQLWGGLQSQYTYSIHAMILPWKQTACKWKKMNLVLKKNNC
jgi:hypothetical protein